MNLIKGGFSRRLASKPPVWQRGFADHLILDPAQFESRRDYIHQNPIRVHLAPPPSSTPTPPPSAHQPIPFPEHSPDPKTKPGSPGTAL
jgi:putative transposase